MVGKRELFARLFYHSRLINVSLLFAKNDLLIFNYHRIRADKSSKDFTEFDAEVFGPTQSEFRNQIKWLKKHTKVISEQDLLGSLDKKKPLSRYSVMITFDDGYLDNYELAYPVLNDLSCPATFFIPTDQIDKRYLGWWDIISYLIKKSKKEIIVYGSERFDLKYDKKTAIRFFLNKMKLENHSDTIQLLNEIAEICNVIPPSKEEQDKQLMTWQHISELSDSGYSIGSHTCSHTVLATIPVEKQKEELLLSKKRIEDKLLKKVYSLSYPVGGYQHFSSQTQEIAFSCGYKLACSFNTGVNRWVDFHPFNVKRIEPATNIEHFAAMVAMPRLFSYH